MAKTSAINRNNKRRKMVAQFAERRAALKNTANDESASMEERFRRASSWPSCRATPRSVRIRNRCEITGRPRGYYRKLEVSRIALRDSARPG
jgi:small subunit ribosomal protein S14